MFRERKFNYLGFKRKMVLFNLSPVSYVHRSWVTGLKVLSLFSNIKNKVIRDRITNHYLLNEIGVKKNFCFDIPPLVFRMILLKSFPAMVLAIGAFFFSDRIKESIRKSEVYFLKGVLGSVLYNLVVKKSDFLFSKKFFAKNKLEYLHNDFNLNSDLKEGLFRTGMFFLRTILDHVNLSLWPRFLLKIPFSYREEVQEVLAVDRTEINIFVSKILDKGEGYVF